MSVSRLEAMGGGLAAMAVAPVTAPEITVVMARDEAPPASDINVWTAYEARLRARLADNRLHRRPDLLADSLIAHAETLNCPP